MGTFEPEESEPALLSEQEVRTESYTLDVLQSSAAGAMLRLSAVTSRGRVDPPTDERSPQP